VRLYPARTLLYGAALQAATPSSAAVPLSQPASRMNHCVAVAVVRQPRSATGRFSPVHKQRSDRRLPSSTPLCPLLPTAKTRTLLPGRSTTRNKLRGSSTSKLRCRGRMQRRGGNTTPLLRGLLPRRDTLEEQGRSNNLSMHLPLSSRMARRRPRFRVSGNRRRQVVVGLVVTPCTWAQRQQ
jgi:hypothetical protein